MANGQSLRSPQRGHKRLGGHIDVFCMLCALCTLCCRTAFSITVDVLEGRLQITVGGPFSRCTNRPANAEIATQVLELEAELQSSKAAASRAVAAREVAEDSLATRTEEVEEATLKLQKVSRQREELSTALAAADKDKVAMQKRLDSVLTELAASEAALALKTALANEMDQARAKAELNLLGMKVNQLLRLCQIETCLHTAIAASV